MRQTLICWLGRTDLRAVTESDRVGVGPVSQALKTGRFSHLELICDYAEDAAAPYLDWLKTQFTTPVTPHFVSLTSPTDFGEITRVGATAAIPVDVRIIAATNRSLTEEVAQGRFREDLFYRLAVAVILLPPVRDREGDAGLLLDRLMDQVNRESKCEPGYAHKKLSAGARNILLARRWPGNVREMLNTLRRAAVWSAGTTIDTDDARDALLPASAPRTGEEQILGQDITQGVDLQGMIDEVARHYMERALQTTGGNKTRAAELLGLASYQTLTNWLKKYRVEK